MAAVETYKGVASPSDCDILGHMNVSRYFAAIGDGMFVFQSMIGLTAGDIKNGRRLSFAVVHAESDFLSEVLEGEAIHLVTGVEKIGNKTARFGHTLYRIGKDAPAFRCHFTCAMLDLVTRKAVPIPDEIRAELGRYMLEAES